jgi:N-acetylhexosamine 1-kinase
MTMLRETMNPDIARKLLKVGEAFRIPGPFFSYEEIKMGNVNHTYKVNYIRDDGSGMAKIKSYLVQRVNTYAFQKPLELMANIDKVTEYIHGHFPTVKCLHFHHTVERNNYLMDKDGFWRLSNYVPSVTFNSCEDLEIVRRAGQAFGDFQMMLSEFDASSLYYTIPDFHNTRKRYEKLKADMAEDPCGRVAEAREELDWLLSAEDEACRLTDLYEAGELPLRVTHNDTKINNVLFDEESLKPLVVIDLDTVMPGLVGHDFGDAIRFAANFVEEDSPEAEKAGLNLNIYWAFAEGFLKETAPTLTEAEAETLGNSCFTLACELSTRFLDDYIIGDKYFKIKDPKHNLTRTRCQIALAKDMRKKMDAMNAIVRDGWNRYRRG